MSILPERQNHVWRWFYNHTLTESDVEQQTKELIDQGYTSELFTIVRSPSSGPSPLSAQQWIHVHIINAILFKHINELYNQLLPIQQQPNRTDLTQS
jgi:ribulose bisphosphate carboxylase small subunit